MKKRLWICFILVAFLIVPISINAETNFSVSCDSSNNNLCKVTCASDESILGVSLTVEVPNGMKVINIKKSENWESGIAQENVFFLNTDTAQTGTFDIGTFNIENSNGSDVEKNVELKYVKLVTSDYNSSEKEDIVEKVKISKTSSNNTVYIAFGIAAVVVIVIVAAIVLKNKKKK